MNEITPSRYRCMIGNCPAIFQLDDGRLLLIGKKAEAPLLDEIAHRIGDDEYAVVVEAGMLENAVAK